VRSPTWAAKFRYWLNPVQFGKCAGRSGLTVPAHRFGVLPDQQMLLVSSAKVCAARCIQTPSGDRSRLR
jgi:hypothetical protein